MTIKPKFSVGDRVKVVSLDHRGQPKNYKGKVTEYDSTLRTYRVEYLVVRFGQPRIAYGHYPQSDLEAL